MKKLTTIILASGLLLGTAGCEKLIQIEETDALLGDVALKTVSNVEAAVIGAYAGFRVDMEYLFNSTFSDEVRTAGEFYNAATTHEWLFGSTDVGLRDNFTAVSPQYSVINRANIVLGVVNTADSTVVGDNTKRARLRGEALFLRAYSHFELFRYYCANYNPDALAMPYMETSTLEKSARIKQGPFFQKMIADITEAKTLLPASVADINRANVAAASALHARIALYMRDWVTAEANATAYINLLPLANIAAFPGIWTDANALEVGFILRRTTATAGLAGGRLGSLYRGTSANPSQIGTVTWQPTDELYNSYDKVNDVRFNSYIKDEPLLVAAGRTSRLVRKYEGGAYGTATENINHAKVFRTAEMVLIRAEARAEQGRFTGANSAESDINMLRTNRITGYAPVTFASKDAAIDAMMMERFKELPFEGHRFFDLKRRNLPVTRLAADAPNVPAQTLAAGNYRFLLPIPQPEILANPLIEQNPGY
jgi:hypothetical protein